MKNLPWPYRFPILKRSMWSWRVIIFVAGIFFLFSACAGPFDSTLPPLSGQIQIDGSTALQPLVSNAATLFEKTYPHVKITVSGGGSLTGLQDVTSRKVSIGNSDVYADPATYPDPDLTDHLVCVIPFTMIVSSDVPITNLTTSEIVDIFTTGKYTNWAQLGGPDLKIVPVVRPATSGTRATFRRYVLSGRDELSNLLTISSSQDLVKAVAHTPGAIGYLAASVLDTQVHTISINGSMATLKNIEAGRYTFWSYEHMYTLSVSDGGPVDTFLKFMLTSQVQQQASGLHYISISDLKFSQLTSNTDAVMLSGFSLPVERKRWRI